jgi:hypothetical protein
MIRRREFIAGLGGAAAWPFAARAQQQATPVIGFLFANAANDSIRNMLVGFLQSLKETGYVEGQNVAIEYRPPPRSGARRRQRPRSFGGEGSDHDHTHRVFHRQ